MFFLSAEVDRRHRPSMAIPPRPQINHFGRPYTGSRSSKENSSAPSSWVSVGCPEEHPLPLTKKKEHLKPKSKHILCNPTAFPHVQMHTNLRTFSVSFKWIWPNPKTNLVGLHRFSPLFFCHGLLVRPNSPAMYPKSLSNTV